MQFTAALAVAAAVLSLSTALPASTSGNGGHADVSTGVSRDIKVNKGLVRQIRKMKKDFQKYRSSLENMDRLSEEQAKFNEYLNKNDAKMASLENVISNQQNVIEEQAAELKSQAEIIEEQSMFDTKINASMSEIEDDVINKTEDFTENMIQLGSEVNSIHQEIDNQTRRLDLHEAGIKKEQETNKALENELSSLERQVLAEKNTNTAQTSQLTKLTTPQYFSVYLKSSKTVPPNELLVFDGVIDDPESLYSRTTGVFECKVPGVYVFTLTAISQRGDGIVRLGIFKGHHLKVTTRNNGAYDQGSSTVTLTLEQGDKVTVKGSWATSHVYGSTARFTTFSGRLVTPAK